MKPMPQYSSVGGVFDRQQSGGSLLMTLIILAALVVIVTIFSRMVLVEKRVTHAYSEVVRSEMAAQAGLADAQQLLLELFTQYPDSATFWDPAMGSSTTPGTVFAYRDIPANEAHVGGTGSTPRIFFRPMVSGATTQLASAYNAALPPAATEVGKAIDINNADFGGDANGWIGKVPDASAPNPIRVPWVEILENPNAAKSATNPAVARYAFWVEDESFKLNVNTALVRPRGQLADEPRQEGSPDPRPNLLGAVTDSSLAEGIVKVRSELPQQSLLSNSQIGHVEGALPEIAGRLRFVTTTTSSGLDISRTGAKRLNINDVVRRSLNGIPNIPYGPETNKTGYDLSNAAVKTRKAVMQIRSAIEANVPNFGQRMYRASSSSTLLNSATATGTHSADKNALVVTGPHASTYNSKIAANIYDFISPTSNPTVIDDSDEVLLGEPILSFFDLGFDMSETPAQEPNPIRAIGRKKLPYLTEYVWCVEVTDFRQNLSFTDYKAGVPVPEDGVATYEFEIDHYFEFWNMFAEALIPVNGDMGPDPYLILEAQPYITTNNQGLRTTNDLGVGRAFKIKLDDDFLVNGETRKLTFEPGAMTIITTDPDYESHLAKNRLTGRTVFVATALYDPVSDERVDVGISTRPFSNPNSPPAMVPNVRSYRISSFDTRDGGDWGEVQIAPNMSTAASTKILLGNRFGLLDAAPSVGLAKYQNNNMFNLPRSGTNSPFTGGQVGGPNRGGWDPRAKLDPIAVRVVEQNSNGAYSTLAMSAPNLGLNVGFAASLTWASDPIAVSGAFSVMNATRPFAVHAGRDLASVGELGHVVDTALEGHYDSTERIVRRSGGRTLSIGQPDTFWDGTRTSGVSGDELQYQVSRSRDWAAWRLADVFTVKTDGATAPRTAQSIQGLYNPNGILRDKGLVLRTLVEGLVFESGIESDPLLAARTFLSAGTETGALGVGGDLLQPGVSGGAALARYMAQRLSRSHPNRFSPLWERGEISQLQMFSPFGHSNATKQQLHAGANIEQVADRGREEIFRRLAELITTRGNTFTVYVVGQAVGKDGVGNASHARKVTIRLEPEWDADVIEDFNPEDLNQVNSRFRKPDRWKARILSIENA